MSDPPHDPLADPAALARDWITLLESELTALANDREARETFQALVSLWAKSASAFLRVPPDDTAAAPDHSAGRSPACKAGATAAAPASGAGDPAVDRLARRVAELEARLAELERDLEQAQAVFASLAETAREPPGAFASQLAASLGENNDLIAGIAAYRRHPFHRDMPEPPAVWAEGASRLLDYLPEGPGTGRPTVLFVPSLVNRATVLDLMDGHSMLRFLAAQGVRPLLLDWGWPEEVERGFTLTDYVAGRLERAIEAAAGLAGQKIVLAGYCMGGTLAVAAAQRRPHLLRGLALLATPWDFHAGDPVRARQLATLLPLLEPLMALSAALPVDALQTLFTLLDPWGVGAKYRAFGALDQASDRARLFVALEDWLNDGVPLAAPVARACLTEWYGENQPARGLWRIAGATVDPRRIALPCLVASPARDRIVPPESARPLAALIPGAELLEPAAGHIGMVAGGTAEQVLWRPLLDWLGRTGSRPGRT